MSPNPEVVEHDRLVRTVTEARAAYYAGAPIMTDADFDAAFHALLDLESSHPELAGTAARDVGAPATRTRRRHPTRMLSLTDVFSLNELDSWVDAVGGDEPMTAEVKYDGCAIDLVYHDGQLVSAETRGDGDTGEDVTDKALLIDGVPEHLTGTFVPDLLEVRGEVYMPPSRLREINEAIVRSNESARARMHDGGRREALARPLANPRNAAAGALLSTNALIVTERSLTFVAHGVGAWEGVPRPATRTELYANLSAMGVPVSPHTRRVASSDELHHYVKDFAAHRTDLECEIDGVVVKLDDLDKADALGQTDRVPRWAVAYKYPPMEVSTTVTDMFVQIGRTGRATPVAELEPVTVSGSTVSRVTLHNAELVEALDVRVGDTVVIRKAGEIIPQLVTVLGEHPVGSSPWRMPTKCPACGNPLAPAKDGDVDLRCGNDGCTAQLAQRLVRLASREALDVDGLGHRVAGWLTGQDCREALLSSPADVFDLTADTLLGIETLDGAHPLRNDDGSLSATGRKLLLSLGKARKNASLRQVMVAMSIRGVGRFACAGLAERFGSWDAIMSASDEQLLAVDGIGPETVEALRTWVADHDDLVNAWRSAGVVALRGSAFATQAPPQTLKDLRIAVTGSVPGYTRAEVKEVLRNRGARATSSVSASTDVLIAGPGAGSKLDKAAQLGVPVLDPKHFDSLLIHGLTILS